jgi:hypothetical protein
MSTYEMFTCPGCESRFRVVFPEPLPSHYAKHSKIKLKCSTCGEVREPYASVLARIMRAPEPGIPSIDALEISPPDPNPPADASTPTESRGRGG